MSKTFLLSGLDGANPLAFLAALGVLRMLRGAPCRGRLGWQVVEGTWRPVVTVDVDGGDRELCARLAEMARLEPPAIRQLGKNLTVAPDVFQAYVGSVEQMLHIDGDGRGAEFAAAFGSEVCVDTKMNCIENTSFSFIRGSGHQDFISAAIRLSESVTEEHLHEALFGPWEYKDESLSFRWNPGDAAEYALSAGNPSKEGVWTVWGANRLAFEALPLLPVQPTRRGLQTTGFREDRNRKEFSWPLWYAPLGVDTIRSLLSHSELRRDIPDRRILGAMGVGEVFRAPRVRIGTPGKFKLSFRPARAV